MSSSCTIAIVGGGLAGLAAAHALRTFGMQAEVFEAAPALGEIGAAVNVSPQAFKALQAIDLGDKVAAVATSSPGIYTRNMQTGEFLEFNDRRKAAARYGAPYYTFHRADLLDALASGLDHSAIHLGHRLTAIEERSDRIVLAFANGAQADHHRERVREPRPDAEILEPVQLQPSGSTVRAGSSTSSRRPLSL